SALTLLSRSPSKSVLPPSRVRSFCFLPIDSPRSASDLRGSDTLPPYPLLSGRRPIPTCVRHRFLERPTWCCAGSAATTRGGRCGCWRGRWRVPPPWGRQTRWLSRCSWAPTTRRCRIGSRCTSTCRSTSTRATSAPSAPTSRDMYGEDDPSKLPERTNEATGTYAQACLTVAKELNHPVIDIWTKMQQFPDWQTSALCRGLEAKPTVWR
ncbi:Os04g0269700, partial [Oryza sativa Japonica Group]